ncbi:diacylglycerol kinase family protein [Parerythrobacter aurantius]|uniref:diacylglycerol kinase family protein n=1 Tax=Parerythrobacter aurantius TaxID=3127706 RepID=UPI0032476CF3
MPGRFVFVANNRSGSFDQALVDALMARAGELGLGVPEARYLPDNSCPSPGELSPDDIVAVFGGDGTIGSVIRSLAGWSGSALVLPGGTMNLASKRLHGDVAAMDIIEAVGGGRTRRRRPTVITSPVGDSLAGVMVGPGTSWSDVREAMRDLDLAGLASSTVRAFATTRGGARVICRDPAIGREDGYPMVEVLPTAGGMSLSGYKADDLGEFAVGLAALLRHDFRSGPCDSFDLADRVTIAAVDGAPVGILVDGDPIDPQQQVTLAVGTSKVDLLVTAPDA